MSKFKVGDPVRVIDIDRIRFDQVGTVASVGGAGNYPLIVAFGRDRVQAGSFRDRDLTLALTDVEDELPQADLRPHLQQMRDFAQQAIGVHIMRGNASAVAAPRSVSFDVDGVVAPQGSKKGFKRGAKIVLVEMSKNLPAWRLRIQQAARAAFTGAALDCPVSVRVTFRIPKPKSTKFQDYPAGPPDTDKLQRAVGDALKMAGVITDDSRIVHWDAAKVWGPAGATITVTEMRSQ